MPEWIPLPENAWNLFNDSATQRYQENIRRIPGMDLFSRTPLGWVVNAPSYIIPALGVTNADRNTWAREAGEQISDEYARNAFFSSVNPTMSRSDIYALAREAQSAGRQADYRRSQERSYLDYYSNMLDAQREHEANLMASQFDFMGGQARADAQMRGLEAGLNYGLQYDIANLQALNNLDVTDAQGWWNSINTGMTTGANVEMNRENARTSRYNTERNARSNERMAGMQTALQARDIANRQLNFWSQQYAR